MVTETPDGGLATAVDHRGIGAVEGELRVRDLGLKVVVDELEGAPFAERTIVEVEYGPRHRRRADAVVARLRAALGGGVLRTKERNKIAYLLAG